MQQDKTCNNNNMHINPQNEGCHEVAHIVVIYIVSSFASLDIHCTCFSDFWYYHPDILQHLNEHCAQDNEAANFEVYALQTQEDRG